MAWQIQRTVRQLPTRLDSEANGPASSTVDDIQRLRQSPLSLQGDNLTPIVID